MKQRYTLILLLALLMGSALPGLSQQIPVSLTQMFRTGMWNPAHSGAVDLNNIHLSHQQRKMTIPGWRSISQFLNYNSQPMGRHGNFGVGALISNDIEHTENRLGMNFAIAVHPVFTKQQRLSLGGSVGMINWNSNYSKAKVFDRNDELIQRAPNFLELDAGLGAEYALWTKKVEFQVSGSAVQLPGNFMSRRLNGLRLNPHLLVGGELLGAPAHNLKVGPVAFYKNTFLRGDTTIGGVRSDSLLLGNTAAMDVGLKGKLDRQDIWAAASYRFNFASLNFAFGAQIYVSDSAKHPTSSVLLVDLNAGFSYPLQESNVFGPTIEFGIDIHFGRPFRKRIDKDSVRFAQKFWENDGTIARHIEDHLAINSPVGLRGNTSVAPKRVTLRYQFPDPTLLYLGTADFEGDSLTMVGLEWMGVDGFLEGMVHEVIREGLTPDTINVMNPEDLEPLRGIEFLELSAFLQANEAEADMAAQGVVYEGELGTNNLDEDTLYLDVVYNGADTIVGVPRNHYITNLELACLKLYTMQRKLRYELQQRYGKQFAFVQEGEEINKKELQGKRPVTIRKPRITPNNPNQDAFQVNQIRIRFSRGFVKSGKRGKKATRVDVDTGKKRKNRRKRVNGIRDAR